MRNKFDPLAIFPGRIQDTIYKAEDIASASARGVGGATDLENHVAYLPTKNTAYHRTVRLHEALHAIYTNPKDKRKSMIYQALEDARLHLNCAKTTGQVRRDELATALGDMKNALACPEKPLSALIALRSSAILASKHTLCRDVLSDSTLASTRKTLKKVCDKISPTFGHELTESLKAIERGDMAHAETLLKPYFGDAEEQQPERVFPGLKRGGDIGDDSPALETDKIPESARIEPVLSSSSSALLSDKTQAAISKSTEMPTMFEIPIYSYDNIRTFEGSDTKPSMSGSKVIAKKLATIVGNPNPKIFSRDIRLDGGSILIDASGSMGITPEMLLELVQKAPMATVGFYNAPTDSGTVGNLWIYSHKGKRALDFSTIRNKWRTDSAYVAKKVLDRIFGGDKKVAINLWGGGNVVDFSALQWLLSQEAPRWFLTDGSWTGPAIAVRAVTELMQNALARKKVKQVLSLEEMNSILEKRQCAR